MISTTKIFQFANRMKIPSSSTFLKIVVSLTLTLRTSCSEIALWRPLVAEYIVQHKCGKLNKQMKSRQPVESIHQIQQMQAMKTDWPEVATISYSE